MTDKGSEDIFYLGIDAQYFANASAFINAILTLYQFSMVCIQGMATGRTYFLQIWSYFDICYIFVNGIVSVSLLDNELLMSIQTLRIVESFLSLVIIMKLIYFTQLMDEVAPLVNIIILIFQDIAWFMIIFIVCGFSFAICFNLIGQNQLDDILILEQDPDYLRKTRPAYMELNGAI
eukprot:CAMPEP_0170512186 /NCGR_PEP_ID=MMETSP0208-20121228/66712_1 /TAXON_ID=197538 /ORGANISM="Strombidium inclinatum, Strain S3" /LENGTH=176 /DNA_ID=CAMNT_0010795795 /DNA_START=1716 /DNA_END=2246 /DNA_ORIENTATION=-